MTVFRHNLLYALSAGLAVGSAVLLAHIARAEQIAESVGSGDAVVLFANDNSETEAALITEIRHHLSGMRVDVLASASMPALLESRVRSGNPWPVDERAPAEIAVIIDVVAADQVVMMRVVDVTTARTRSLRRFSIELVGSAAIADEFAQPIATAISLDVHPPQVISSRRSGIVINGGRERGLAAGMLLDLYKPAEATLDLESGELVLGAETLVGQIKLDLVVDRLSEASLISGDLDEITVGVLCRLRSDSASGFDQSLPIGVPDREANSDHSMNVETDSNTQEP